MSCESKIPKVLIQYNCIAHYRKPIFEALSARSDIEFTIVADTKTDTESMKVVSDSDNRIRFVVAKRYDIRLGNRLTLFWQPSACAMVGAFKPDLLICLANPYSLTAWCLLIRAKLLNIPVLLWGHGLLKTELGFKSRLRDVFYKLGAGHLLYGDYAKHLMVGKGYDPGSLFVIYNSLDYDTQARVAESYTDSDKQDFRTTLGISEGQGLIVISGRLNQAKKLDLLLLALKDLLDKGRVVHLAMIGDGPERASLSEFGEKLGIEKLLHFMGEIYDETRLGLIIGASDVCVIPSAAGLSIMHALVYGTPVIIHNKLEDHGPEWEAVKAGETGYFYQADNIQDLSDKIEAAIFEDPCKSFMADACKRAIAEKYNPHRQADMFAAAVKATLQARVIDGGGRKASFEHPHPNPLPEREGARCTFVSAVTHNSTLGLRLREMAKGIRAWWLLKTKYRGIRVGKGFHLGNNVTIHGPDFKAGDYVYIGHDSEIAPRVSIGNYSCLSSHVVITGADHVFDIPGTPIRFSGRPESVSTWIGDDVLVGHGVTIIRGVSIGNGAIIGAGAVVTKDIPPYSIAGGVPARVIKSRFTEEERRIHEAMLAKPTRFMGYVPKLQ